MVRLAIIGNAGLPQLLASTAWLTGSVVAAVVLTARVIHLARKRIVITAQKNFLTVVHSSPMTREKRQEWPRNEIAAIRLGYASRQLFTEKGLALCLFTKEGRRVNVFAGDEEDELRWLATVLRQTLSVPANSSP
jgi:hypothetical protein